MGLIMCNKLLGLLLRSSFKPNFKEANYMCELLGLNFNEPVTCSFSFLRFRQRGNDHPDRWGIGRYNAKSLQLSRNRQTVGAYALSFA